MGLGLISCQQHLLWSLAAGNKEVLWHASCIQGTNHPAALSAHQIFGGTKQLQVWGEMLQLDCRLIVYESHVLSVYVVLFLVEQHVLRFVKHISQIPNFNKLVVDAPLG